MLAYALPLCIVAGILGFTVGVLLQQHASYRGIHSAMACDPYIYQSRMRIYDALKLVGRERLTSGLNINESTYEVASSEDVKDPSMLIYGSQAPQLEESGDSDSVFANYVRWFQINMHVVTMFFTFSLDNGELAEPEPTHVATLMKYGFPGLDDIHIYRNFVLSYDRRNRIAHWVCEHLESECLTSTDSNSLIIPNEFLVDTSIPLMFRASPRDYRNTDWVGCHMATPFNYRCDHLKHMETYIMTNIAPLSRGLKANLWTRLEVYVRELAIDCGSVYVYTGPLFMPQRITFRNWAIRHQVIGMNTIAVPTHYFKVIIVERQNRNEEPFMEGYVVPNIDVDRNLELNSFLSDIRDIEHFAGLKFYNGARRPPFHHNNQTIDTTM